VFTSYNADIDPQHCTRIRIAVLAPFPNKLSNHTCRASHAVHAMPKRSNQEFKKRMRKKAVKSIWVSSTASGPAMLLMPPELSRNTIPGSRGNKKVEFEMPKSAYGLQCSRSCRVGADEMRGENAMLLGSTLMESKTQSVEVSPKNMASH